ncbi:MAG: hypothetical protein C0507_14575 [Cyanobacteria bacterium PR.3.49]|nr:hypothetical protein [Cyanobacteria bacterium PR.3.49]
MNASKEAYCSKWIINPAIDLLFCCGGAVWILFAVHYLVVGPNSTNMTAQLLLTIAALGTIFFSETHTIASMVRLYGEKRFESGFTLYTRVIPLCLSPLCLVACTNSQVPPLLAKVYLLIVSQHFTKQTYGIVLLYCLKRKFQMDAWDKHLLAGLMQATMVFAIVRQLTYRSWSGEQFLGQKIPFWGPLPEWIFFLCAFWLTTAAILFCSRMLLRFYTKRESFPLPATILTATGVAIFVVGSDLSGTLWTYVPAFFHGSQYLTVTTSVYLKDQGIRSSSASTSSLLLEKGALKYFGFLLLAGIAVFAGIPHILQQFRFDYAMALTAVFTTVQFHHVLVDHAIWRMKNKDTRDLLIA